MARRLPAVLIAVALAIGLGACGERDGEGAEEVTTTIERPTVACRGVPVARTGLPESFPEVAGVTYTKAQTAGPTEIVDGYFEGALPEAYQRVKAAFRRAGYDVIFDEIEQRDSEVSYIGGGRTGQFALRAVCREEGLIAVHITSRPE